MTNPFDAITAGWIQTIERAEALHFDQLSGAEAFEVVRELWDLRAEMDAFEAKVRAELHRRAVARQFN